MTPDGFRDGDIAIMKMELHFLAIVRIAVNVIDAAGVEGTGPANESVDLVSFG